MGSEACTTAGLLAAADKYQLAELKSACQAALAASLSPANCLDLLILVIFLVVAHIISWSIV